VNQRHNWINIDLQRGVNPHSFAAASVDHFRSPDERPEFVLAVIVHEVQSVPGITERPHNVAAPRKAERIGNPTRRKIVKRSPNARKSSSTFNLLIPTIRYAREYISFVAHASSDQAEHTEYWNLHCA